MSCTRKAEHNTKKETNGPNAHESASRNAIRSASLRSVPSAGAAAIAPTPNPILNYTYKLHRLCVTPTQFHVQLTDLNQVPGLNRC